ncbi:MAG: (d)CMP kinase [Erysipelotrichaceae bacterium]|nr:(d)CMP kinase [Erysipelotrichaceae bacterium]
MTYGLIGEKLSHSFSKQIHERLASYTYHLISLNKQEFISFMNQRQFKAINVTIPYKKEVLPYLDSIDESAQVVGAVNTIVHRNKQLIGYNTDTLGFAYVLKKYAIQLHGKKVLIIGSGGACCAIKAVVEKAQPKEIIIVNKTQREGVIDYETCYTYHKDVEVIINTSPVGMYPNILSTPIDLTSFPHCKVVMDLIYNPLHTLLYQQTKRKNLQYINGMEMLIAQAKYAVEIFLQTTIDDKIIDTLYEEILHNKLNLVFIGMPGAGKSTIAKALAQHLQKEFIDTDQLIEQTAQQKIGDIFAKYGEDHFRELEKQVCLKVATMHNKIIATGGGVVKNEDIMNALASNSILLYLDRDLQLIHLHNEHRPLAQNKTMLISLYNERAALYDSFADYTFQNNESIEQTVQQIIHTLPHLFKQYRMKNKE